MKKLLALFAAVITTSLLLYGLVSLDSFGKHPVVSAAVTAPIIPVRDFFAPNNSRWDYRVSQRGRWLAWREADVWGQRVLLAPVDKLTSPQIVTEEPVKDLFFLRDGRLGLKVRIGTVAVPPKKPDRANWSRVPPNIGILPSSAKTSIQGLQPQVNNDRGRAFVAIHLRRNGPADIVHPVGDSHDASALTPKGEMFLRLVRGNETDLGWSIEASARDGEIYVVNRLAGLTQRGRRLVDLRRQFAREIGTSAVPPPDEGQAVRSETVALTHADGRRMRARLAKPQTGGKPGPLPAVIVAGSDGVLANGWGGDRVSRFLANRGYAVLSLDIETLTQTTQVAKTPVDPDVALDTIAGAAEWLIEAQIADKNAIAIMGQGYGGTMALLAASRNPDLFKAAIAHSPVTDLVLQSSLPVVILQRPGAESTGFAARRITQTMQHLKENGGRAALEAYSPLSQIGDVTGPVLLTHGAADTVIPVAQTKAYAAALARAGSSVETAYFDSEGHFYSDWRTQVRVARLTEHFLAKTLGGRDGRYDYVELIAKFF